MRIQDNDDVQTVLFFDKLVLMYEPMKELCG